MNNTLKVDIDVVYIVNNYFTHVTYLQYNTSLQNEHSPQFFSGVPVNHSIFPD